MQTNAEKYRKMQWNAEKCSSASPNPRRRSRPLEPWRQSNIPPQSGHHSNQPHALGSWQYSPVSSSCIFCTCRKLANSCHPDRDIDGMWSHLKRCFSYILIVRRTDKIGTGVLSAKAVPIARYISRAQAWWRYFLQWCAIQIWTDLEEHALTRKIQFNMMSVCTGQDLSKQKEKALFGKNNSSTPPLMIHGWDTIPET